MAEYWAIPRDWPQATVVCLGGGPSLTPEDVEACAGRARVIAVNDAYRLAPWADALFAADQKWWNTRRVTAAIFPGERVTFDARAAARWDCLLVRDDGFRRDGSRVGLSTLPDGLAHGNNGGHAAIDLAVHRGATRILLLGYDCQPGADGRQHWHDNHALVPRRPYRLWLDGFAVLPPLLAARGVEVINCTRQTALRCFPCQTLSSAL